MRIFERLRERQSQRFVELDSEAEIAPVGANTVHSPRDFQPTEAAFGGHSAETPQAATGHA